MNAPSVHELFRDEYPKFVRRNDLALLYLASNVILLLPPTRSPLAIAWFKDRLTPEQRRAYDIARFRDLRNPTASDFTRLLDALSQRPP